jgi:hypothetical protein
LYPGPLFKEKESEQREGREGLGGGKYKEIEGEMEGNEWYGQEGRGREGV